MKRVYELKGMGVRPIHFTHLNIHANFVNLEQIIIKPKLLKCRLLYCQLCRPDTHVLLIITYDNLSQCKTTLIFQARSTKGQD